MVRLPANDPQGDGPATPVMLERILPEIGMVKTLRPAGFEPATLCLEGRCSIQLSYGREKNGRP
jgi:hypothetical protein